MQELNTELVMSVFRSGLRLVSTAHTTVRVAPILSTTVRHGGGGPKPVSNVLEPNGFLFNEKVCNLLCYGNILLYLLVNSIHYCYSIDTIHCILIVSMAIASLMFSY